MVNDTQNTQRSIGAVRFNVTDHRGAIAEVKAALLQRSCRVFVFCNMHTFNLCTRLPVGSRPSRTTVFNDGVGIDMASSILFGERFPANLNGTDFTPLLLESLERPVRVYLLGTCRRSWQRPVGVCRSDIPGSPSRLSPRLFSREETPALVDTDSLVPDGTAVDRHGQSDPGSSGRQTMRPRPARWYCCDRRAVCGTCLPAASPPPGRGCPRICCEKFGSHRLHARTPPPLIGLPGGLQTASMRM